MGCFGGYYLKMDINVLVIACQPILGVEFICWAPSVHIYVQLYNSIISHSYISQPRYRVLSGTWVMTNEA